LLIYNIDNEVTTVLISAEVLALNVGTGQNGEEWTLGFVISLNEEEGSLEVLERSLYLISNEDGSFSESVASEISHSYTLSDYRLASLGEGKTYYLNLISENGIETIQFDYEQSVSLSIEIFNSLGQRFTYSYVSGNSDYSLRNPLGEVSSEGFSVRQLRPLKQKAKLSIAMACARNFAQLGIYVAVLNDNGHGILTRKFVIR